jgi:cation diffusion facilitator CzcD-associated flavoprotein CzcO
MFDRPHVCVIGAGVSGLVAVKALGDWGVAHTCYEANASGSLEPPPQHPYRPHTGKT